MPPRACGRARANTQRGSRQNTSFHCDLGNAFYAQWLDADMQYSSALCRTGQETLEETQAAKLGAVLELLGARPGHEVLGIGCSWGGLATLLAHGRTRVTGLTLSTQQRAAAEGVADRVDRFFVLGCVDLDAAFALPIKLLHEHLQELHTTTVKNGPTYWHIKLLESKVGQYSLQMPKTGNHISLTQYAFKLVALN